MAFDLLFAVKSFNAINAALPNQFVFVTIDTSGGIALPTSGGDAIGVLQDTPLQGDPGSVCGPGSVTKVLCSTTITAGQLVSTDGAGNAVPATSGAFVLGKALTAGSSGYLADILYQPQGRLDP